MTVFSKDRHREIVSMTVFFSQSVSQLFHGPGAPRSPRCSSHTVIDDAQKTLPPLPGTPNLVLSHALRQRGLSRETNKKKMLGGLAREP